VGDDDQMGLFDAPARILSGDVVITLPERATYNARDSLGKKIIILDHMEKTHKEWLRVARSVAIQVAGFQGTVTAEDVRKRLEAADIFPRHCNAYGALFKVKDFEFTGDWKKSTVVKHHASDLRVWRLSSRGVIETWAEMSGEFPRIAGRW